MTIETINKTLREYLLSQEELLAELETSNEDDFYYDAMDTILKVAQYRVDALKYEVDNYFDKSAEIYTGRDVIIISNTINSIKAALDRITGMLDKLEYSTPWTFRQIVEYTLDMV